MRRKRTSTISTPYTSLIAHSANILGIIIDSVDIYSKYDIHIPLSISIASNRYNGYLEVVVLGFEHESPTNYVRGLIRRLEVLSGLIMRSNLIFYFNNNL